RTGDDVERLRKVVREAMCVPRYYQVSMLCSTADGLLSRNREDHTQQWSQTHEACLSEMRRQLRKTRSPLLRAKDPAVLVGALLRRQ
ncbi:unnamed protein product, partial [Sphacelaria rigidula]